MKNLNGSKELIVKAEKIRSIFIERATIILGEATRLEVNGEWIDGAPLKIVELISSKTNTFLTRSMSSCLKKSSVFSINKLSFIYSDLFFLLTLHS